MNHIRLVGLVCFGASDLLACFASLVSGDLSTLEAWWESWKRSGGRGTFGIAVNIFDFLMESAPNECTE